MIFIRPPVVPKVHKKPLSQRLNGDFEQFYRKCILFSNGIYNKTELFI